MDLTVARKRQTELFTHHLPYELDMLDAATAFMSAEARDDPTRLGWFRAQSAVEAFWMHARLLMEFFTRPRTPSLTDDPNDFVPDIRVHHASALDFASKFESKIKSDLIKTKINPQIVHINYMREVDQLKKLGAEVGYIKPQIDNDVRNFVAALDEKWLAVWRDCEWWQKREPVQPDFLVMGAVSTTSVYGGWVTNIYPLPKGKNFEMNVVDLSSPRGDGR